MEKPFLDDKFQISWSNLKPEYIVSDITEAIENAQKRIDSLSKTDFPEEGLTFENTLIALESAYEFLSGPWGLVSHLDSVSNSDGYVMIGEPDANSQIGDTIYRVGSAFITAI